MKSSEFETDPDTLATQTESAVRLLWNGEFAELAEKFGYALAFQKSPEEAIRDDLAACLAERNATTLVQTRLLPAARVKYFDQPGESGPVALIEYDLQADSGGEVLLELIVTHNGAGRSITIEQIS